MKVIKWIKSMAFIKEYFLNLKIKKYNKNRLDEYIIVIKDKELYRLSYYKDNRISYYISGDYKEDVLNTFFKRQNIK